MRRPTSTRSRWALSPVFAVLAFAAAAIVSAQTDVTTSRISGFARTADGSALPGVTVTATNRDTGLTKTAVADKNGFYHLVNLPTGVYKLDAVLDGFTPLTAESVKLILGSTPSIDFTLSQSRVTAAVTVQASAAVVESTRTAVSTTIETEQLKHLPLNGRDFKSLVVLIPSARIESERGTLAISGQRGINTNVTVDGVDYNNSFFGGTIGGAEGRAPLSLSEESIKELTVITNGASVEFGRSGGGFVNVITKSGTNSLHGAGFFFWQPLALIADFANGTAPRDQDKKQYGGSLGGAFLKDHLFFFGSFDKQLRSETVPIDSAVLDPAIFARYPALSSGPDYIQTQNGYVLFGRVDWQINGSQRVMGRANRVTYDGQNGTSSGQTRTASYNGLEGLTTWAAVGQWSGQFGSSALNDLNFNWVNEDTPRLDKDLNLTEVQLGSFRYGEVSFLPIVSTVKRKAVGDTFTYLLSSHVAKFGGEYNDTSVDQIFKGNWRGVYIFNNKADLLAGNWSQYRQFGGLSGLTADQAGKAAFGQKEYAAFIQDQWFINAKLTVTLGVRYEYLNNPNAPILNQFDVNANSSFKLTSQIPDVKNQWSPRLSFSWAPDSKTALRLSAGRYWSRTPALLWAQPFTSNGYQATQTTLLARTSGGIVVGPPTDPLCATPGVCPGWGSAFNPVGVAPIDFSKVTAAARPGVFAVDPNFTNPHTDRVTLGFEREIVPLVAASLDLTYAKGTNLQRLTDLNRMYDGTTSTNGLPHYSSVRPNSFYGTITTSKSDAISKYDEISLRISRRFADHWSVSVSAALSHDRDNDSNERNFAGIQAEDFNNLDLNYGYANRDQRWRTSVNGIWETPLVGIVLSGSFRFSTGGAFTPLANSDVNGDGQSSTDRATVAGRHLGRNSYRNPNFYSLDMRLGKSLVIAPVEILAFIECFNLTNTGNRFVTNTSFGTGQTPAAGFGVPAGVGTPRTGQVGVRVSF
ncbi:MAG: TonB-dependent receptor [Thermoanaerobaculia bacterium]